MRAKHKEVGILLSENYIVNYIVMFIFLYIYIYIRININVLLPKQCVLKVLGRQVLNETIAGSAVTVDQVGQCGLCMIISLASSCAAAHCSLIPGLMTHRLLWWFCVSSLQIKRLLQLDHRLTLVIAHESLCNRRPVIAN